MAINPFFNLHGNPSVSPFEHLVARIDDVEASTFMHGKAEETLQTPSNQQFSIFLSKHVTLHGKLLSSLPKCRYFSRPLIRATLFHADLHATEIMLTKINCPRNNIFCSICRTNEQGLSASIKFWNQLLRRKDKLLSPNSNFSKHGMSAV